MAEKSDSISTPTPSLAQVVKGLGVYPIEAFQFVQAALSLTVQRLHGNLPPGDESRHITGKELCEGLRDIAQERWGYLAATVLERWSITSTLDFGRIVFAMVQSQLLTKTDQDSLDDFRRVFDFKTVFEREYRIAGHP